MKPQRGFTRGRSETRGNYREQDAAKRNDVEKHRSASEEPQYAASSQFDLVGRGAIRKRGGNYGLSTSQCNQSYSERASADKSNDRVDFRKYSKWQERQQSPNEFGLLEEISNKDPSKIVFELSMSNSFSALLDGDSVSSDFFILIMKILSKISDSGFDEIKVQLFVKVCCSKFMDNLIIYFMDIPNNNIEFWFNFITFGTSIINVTPTIACEKLGLVLVAAKQCIKNVQENKMEDLGNNIEKHLEKLEFKLALCIEERSKKNLTDDLNIDCELPYTMVETELYFKPNTFDNQAFVNNFPFKEYIIHLQPNINPPGYLHGSSKYEFLLENGYKLSKKVKNVNEWPTRIALGLNESQFQAYQLALLREFAVIQGPPGTGKTFLGLKLVETLLRNLNFENTPMLIVCYTNETLDQFLEGVSNFSKSFVRMGGQSKSSKMKKYSIKNLSKEIEIDNSCYSAMRNIKVEIKSAIKPINKLHEELKLLCSHEHLISYSTLQKFIPSLSEFFNEYKKIGWDPVLLWLLECVEREKVTNVDFDSNAIERLINKSRFPSEGEKHLSEDILIEKQHFRQEFNNINFEVSYSLDKADKEISCLYGDLSRMIENSEEEQDCYQFKIFLGMKVAQYQYVKECLLNYNAESAVVCKNVQAKNLRKEERWALYFQWIYIAKEIMEQKKIKLEKDYKKIVRKLEEIQTMYDNEFLKHFQLIGITAADAAEQQTLLKSLASPVVIVEEAADVMEMYTDLFLTEYCQHLILIGDHEQLHPSIEEYRLAKHKKSESSLFKRLVENGKHCCTLEVQHRMRPEIAQLIAPHIYSDLKNHESVQYFPKVRGIMQNLYFLDHNVPEDEIYEDASNRKNCYEADFVIKLARYIMQQGYEPQDLTILTTYTGQMFYLLGKKKDHPILAGVQITVLENFKGKESKIIILSLVRSNAEASIGFLKNKTRICLALSRAKEGCYIVGNMANLSAKSKWWMNVNETLKDQNAIGTSLTLQCENHKAILTKVCRAEHFDHIVEGGCAKMCGEGLACGHVCPSICHAADRNHQLYKCKQSCIKVLCERGHDCPLMCCIECKPCEVEVNKMLPCGHEQKIPCYIKRTEFKCEAKFEVVLEDCGHKAISNCNQALNSVICMHACEDRLPCGHTCVLTCHKNSDPDHLDYTCRKDCKREMQNCSAGHKCSKQCYEKCGLCTFTIFKVRNTCSHGELVDCHLNVNEVSCMERCERIIPICGHSCKQLCCNPCGGCEVIVEKTLLCGHVAERPCEENELMDYKPPPCTELVDHTIKPPCGHTINVPCDVATNVQLSEEELLSYCQQKCDATLLCGHECAGNCETCYQGRLHQPCQSKCGRTLICGHLCEVPCSQVCPPCKKKCNIKCVHSKCPKICGEPCVECIEKCTYSCQHEQCSNVCGKICSREPCNKKCPKKLNKCGHSCQGVCGEPCPKACRRCDPQNFPLDHLMNINEPYDDDVKLVQLDDCGHMFDVNDFDRFMNVQCEYNEISLKCCPLCKQPIINTRRYSNQIKVMLADINQVKQSLFGDPEAINNERMVLLEKIKTLRNDNTLLSQSSTGWLTILNTAEIRLQPIRNQRRQNMSETELISVEYIIGTLSFLADDYKEVAQDPGNEWILSQIHILTNVLQNNSKFISQQLRSDIDIEIKRCSYISQYIKLLRLDSYKEGKNQTHIKNADDKVKEVIFTYKVFDNIIVENEIQNFARLLKTVVTRAERILVVKAMNFSKGHWYRCPQGHLYAIADCGRAIITAKCPECGEIIGGYYNQGLLPSNRPDLDVGV